HVGALDAPPDAPRVDGEPLAGGRLDRKRAGAVGYVGALRLVVGDAERSLGARLVGPDGRAQVNDSGRKSHARHADRRRRDAGRNVELVAVRLHRAADGHAVFGVDRFGGRAAAVRLGARLGAVGRVGPVGAGHAALGGVGR